jgi:hypothetical protein
MEFIPPLGGTIRAIKLNLDSNIIICKTVCKEVKKSEE